MLRCTCGDTTFSEYTAVGAASTSSGQGAAQTCDDNGNLTGHGAKAYKWDAFNRLREVWTTGGGAAKIVTYLYDATNRRVRKDLVSGTDIDYNYDGWQIVEEHENAAANPSRQFVFGSYIDEPLCMDVNTDGDTSCIDADGSQRLFYHQNSIYSVCALTDSTGAIVEAYEYDPYGKHWLISGPGSDTQWFTADDTRAAMAASAYGNPYTFIGREFDAETGLHFYRFRYFSEVCGAFLTRDPLGSEVGNSTYLYCLSNPMQSLDPLGLESASNQQGLQLVHVNWDCGSNFSGYLNVVDGKIGNLTLSKEITGIYVIGGLDIGARVTSGADFNDCDCHCRNKGSGGIIIAPRDKRFKGLVVDVRECHEIFGICAKAGIATDEWKKIGDDLSKGKKSPTDILKWLTPFGISGASGTASKQKATKRSCWCEPEQNFPWPNPEKSARYEYDIPQPTDGTQLDPKRPGKDDYDVWGKESLKDVLQNLR